MMTSPTGVSPLASGLAGLRFALASLVPWRAVVRVRARSSGLRFWVHRRDVIGRHIAKYGEHEPALTAFVARRLAEAPGGGLFVDVGANFGWHALHAARHPSVTTVVAFEPDPFNAWLLARNCGEQGVDKVILCATAVGAASGTARLYRYKASNLGRHSLVGDFGRGSRQVPLVTLDHALQDLGLAPRPVLALKIDVEGYEPAVIAGATQTLTRASVVLIEHSPARSQQAGLSSAAMLDVLYAAGLLPHRLDGDGAVQRLARAALEQNDGVIDVIWLREPLR